MPNYLMRQVRQSHLLFMDKQQQNGPKDTEQIRRSLKQPQQHSGTQQKLFSNRALEFTTGSLRANTQRHNMDEET